MTGFCKTQEPVFLLSDIGQKFLRRNTEKLCQGEKIRCAWFGNAAFPFGNSLPADAKMFRNKFLCHFAFGTVFPQGFAQRFFDGILFFSCVGRVDVFSERFDKKNEEIDKRTKRNKPEYEPKDDCEGYAGCSWCHDKTSFCFFRHIVPKISAYIHQLSRNFWLRWYFAKKTVQKALTSKLGRRR